MKNYPIFKAPDEVWDTIQSKISKQKRFGLFSRFVYYQRIKIATMTFVVLCILGITSYILISKNTKDQGQFQIAVNPEENQIIVNPEKEQIIVNPEEEQIMVNSEEEQIVVNPEENQIAVNSEEEQIVVNPQSEQIIVDPQEKYIAQINDNIIENNSDIDQVIDSETTKLLEEIDLLADTADENIEQDILQLEQI